MLVKNIKKFRVNQYIRVPEIRVIDENGQQLGIMKTTDALALAEEKDLDLVEVSPVANPPVCKILDYGKFLYEQKQEQKKQKAKSKEIITKEIRIGLNTGEHDLQFKAKNARKFLLHDNKVKINLTLKGREHAHQDIARNNIAKFIEMIEVPVIVEKGIAKEQRGISTTIIRDKTKKYEDKNENQQVNSETDQGDRSKEANAEKTETESL